MKNTIQKALFLLSIFWTLSLGYVSTGSTTSEGITLDQLPSYYTLNGLNAIRVPLTSRLGNRIGINYFLRMWIRPSNFNPATATSNNTQVFLDINRTLTCRLQAPYAINCSRFNATTSNHTLLLDINSADLFIPKMWTHVAVSGSQQLNLTYLKADYQEQELGKIEKSLYLPVIQRETTPIWTATIGANSNLAFGFLGDVREFLFIEEYVSADKIPIVKNTYLSWDFKNLGYYRLQSGNLQDEFRGNMTGVLAFVVSSVSQKPTWEFENRPNDICFQHSEVAELLRLDGLRSNNASIDSRMRPVQTFVQYSASFWLRTKPGMNSSAKFNESLTIFRLDGIFSIWFTSNQTLRINIYGAKQTKDIFIPLDQWCNLQFVLDSIGGYYEVRVYDLYRRQVFNITEKTSYSTQIYNNQFKLFDNFKGYIKSIMVVQALRDFPLESSYGTSTDITDNSLIIFYKFDYQNFFKGLQSLGKTVRNVFGPTVAIPGGLSFETVEWEEYLLYDDQQKLGTVNQTVSFFDGVACKKLNSDYILALSGVNSHIKYNMKEIKAEIKEATVEFWFKRENGSMNSNSNRNYLFSLYNTKIFKEYFSIYQEIGSSYISCNIFSEYDKVITYAIDNDLYANKWSHLSCKFRSQQKIKGFYSPIVGEEYDFTQDITQINVALPAGTYDMILGNTNQTNKGQDYMILKEVRFWQEYRELVQIWQYKYAQIDPVNQPNIVSYYRLSQAIFNFTNFPYLQTQKVASYYGLTLAKYETTPLNCPLNTFPQQNKLCKRNPFTKLNIIVLANYNPLTQNLTWTVTSQYSDMANDFTNVINFRYDWKSDNSTLNDLLISQFPLKGLNTFTLTQDFLSKSPELSNYQLQLQAQNYLKTFMTSENSIFKINPCRYLADNDTQTSAKIDLIYESYMKGKANILKEFWYYSKPNCNTVTNTSSEQVILNATQVVSYPSYLNFTQVNVIYDNTLKIFLLNISRTDQLKIPNYQYVTFIISVFWGVDGTVIPESKLNLVYRLKFTDLYQTSLNVIKKSVQAGSGLILTGGDDIISQAALNDQDNPVDKDQIMQYVEFQWTCDDTFKAICDRQKNQQDLVITEADYLTFELIVYLKYTFNVTIRNKLDPYDDLRFSKGYEITYVSDDRPYFTISLVNKTRVLIAEDNAFQVNIKNYNPASPNIITEWKISTFVNSQYLDYSNYNTTLIIKQGGLLASLQYNITATVSNSLVVNSKYSDSYIFFTGQGTLVQGSFTVSPGNGTEALTIFTFTLSNWQSDYAPIYYDLFGIFENGTNVKINTDSILVSRPYSTLLPYVKQVRAAVYDSKFNYQQATVTVRVDDKDTEQMDDATWNLTYYFDAMDILANVPYSYNYAAFTVNRPTLDQKLVILYNISNLTSTIQENVYDNDSYYNRVLVNRTMRILVSITNNTNQMNHTIATFVMDIFQQVQNKTQAIQRIINNQLYAHTYANIISSLHKYTNEKLSFLSKEVRLLFVNTMNYNDLRNFLKSIYNEKLKFQNRFCVKINETEAQKVITTYSFRMIMEKINRQSNLTDRDYIFTDEAISTLKIGEVINYMSQKYQIAANFCIQASLYSSYPISGYTFTEQASSFGKFLTYDMYDESTKKQIFFLNDTVTSRTENQSMVVTGFKYNYDESSSNKFSNNQSVCMSIKAGNQEYTGSRWNEGTCLTEYRKDSKFMYCNCTTLQNSYYSIVTDYTRDYVDDKPPPEVIPPGPPPEYSVYSYVYILIVFLLLLLGSLIAASYLLDKKDRDNLENEIDKVEPDLLLKLSNTLQTPIAFVKERQKQLMRFQKLREFSRLRIFMVIFLDLHPLTSLYLKYDVMLERLVRAAIYSNQIMLMALICLIASYISFLGDEETIADVENLSQDNQTMSFLLGFFLSVMLFPCPIILLNKLKKEVELGNQPIGGKVKASDLEKNKEDILNSKKKKGKQSSPEAGRGPQDTDRQNDENGRPDFENHQILMEGGEKEDQESKRNQRAKNKLQMSMDEERKSHNQNQSQSSRSQQLDGPKPYQFSHFAKQSKKKNQKYLQKATLKSLMGINSHEEFIDNQKTYENSHRDQEDAENANEQDFDNVVDKAQEEEEEPRPIFKSKTEALEKIAKIPNKNMVFLPVTFLDTKRKLKQGLVIGSGVFALIVIILIGVLCSLMGYTHQTVFVQAFFFCCFMSWVILNPLRIFLIAYFIQDLVLYQQLGNDDDDRWLNFVDSVIASSESKFMMIDILIIKEFVKLKFRTKYAFKLESTQVILNNKRNKAKEDKNKKRFGNNQPEAQPRDDESLQIVNPSPKKKDKKKDKKNKSKSKDKDKKGNKLKQPKLSHAESEDASQFNKSPSILSMSPEAPQLKKGGRDFLGQHVASVSDIQLKFEVNQVDNSFVNQPQHKGILQKMPHKLKPESAQEARKLAIQAAYKESEENRNKRYEEGIDEENNDSLSFEDRVNKQLENL